MEKVNRYCTMLGIEPPNLDDISWWFRLNLRETIIAALLANGGPMSLEELAESVGDTFACRSTLEPARSIPRAWGGREPICRDLSGRYCLDLHSSELDRFLMMKNLRRGLPPLLRQFVFSLRPDNEFSLTEPQIEEFRVIARRDEVTAATCRRAILHCVPNPRNPAAFGLLDAGGGEARIFLDHEFGDALRALGAFDVLAGVNVRHAVEALGADPDRFILRDVGRVQRRRRRKGEAPAPKFALDRAIRATTGLDSPNAPDQPGQLLAASAGVLEVCRGLAADLEALLAWYRFGVLHRYVHCGNEAGFDLVEVSWAEPGDLTIPDHVRAALRSGRALEVVLGAAPAPGSPWREARRVRPRDRGLSSPELVDLKTGDPIPARLPIQAIRLI